ncbi:uncharacterized protein LOC127831966 [Dreissena polymorpha]|uniref:uncharacterized protein LOC127831966 n=1 Tax=Dreissena polymorpha TaxID=45954 RepID=UPI00226545C1|nr:uncharacterized protein LOC127831966 [Dreissena polymorpha]
MEMWCMSEPKINSFLSLPDGFADSATYNGSDLDTNVDVTRPGNPRQRSPCFDSREMWILSQMCHPSVNGGSVLQRFQGIHASVRQRTNEQTRRECLEFYEEDEILVMSPSFKKKTVPLSDELSYSPTYIDHN